MARCHDLNLLWIKCIALIEIEYLYVRLSDFEFRFVRLSECSGWSNLVPWRENRPKEDYENGNVKICQYHDVGLGSQSQNLSSMRERPVVLWKYGG